MTFAPAFRTTSTFSRTIPPSTSMSVSRFRLFSIARASRIFLVLVSIYFCPPKPGSTVITRSISIRSRYGRASCTLVDGLIAIPTRFPCSRMAAITAPGSGADSRWKVIPSAPQSAKFLMYRSGSFTIRCTSKNWSVRLRMLLITGMPNEIDGTKAPSMTSI